MNDKYETTNIEWMTVAQVHEGKPADGTTVFVVSDTGERLQVARVEKGQKGWYDVYLVGGVEGDSLKRRAGFLLNVQYPKPETPENTEVVERVKALFAKANSTNNQHERDAFERGAFRIMMAHNVQVADLSGAGSAGETVSHVTFDVFKVNKFEIKDWRKRIAVACANAYLCKAYHLGTSRMMMVGTTTNQNIALFVYLSICNQLEEASRVALAQARADGNTATGTGSHGKDPYAWLKTFLDAASYVVVDRLSAMVKQEVTHDNGLGSIIAVNHTDIDVYMNANFKVGKPKGEKSQFVGHVSAKVAGYKAGDAVNLNTGIDGDQGDDLLED